MADESVLQNPADHSVDAVTAALADVSVEEVEAVRELEREGKNRKGITEYLHPSERSPEPVVESYDVAGWKARARAWLGVSPHAVAGALHGEDGPWTQTEVEDALERFLEPPVESKEEAA